MPARKKAAPTRDQQAKTWLAKARRKPAPSEHALQAALVTWCRGIGWGIVRGRFFAIPNGAVLAGDARARAIACNRLKAEGMTNGAPDLVFYGDHGRTLWMEMKLGSLGVVSDSQRAVHQSLVTSGHNLVIARSLAAAIQIIVNFYRP